MKNLSFEILLVALVVAGLAFGFFVCRPVYQLQCLVAWGGGEAMQLNTASLCHPHSEFHVN